MYEFVSIFTVQWLSSSTMFNRGTVTMRTMDGPKSRYLNIPRTLSESMDEAAITQFLASDNKHHIHSSIVAVDPNSHKPRNYYLVVWGEN